MAEQKGRKIVVQNKKAYHEYTVLERYEAGIELFGTEVKSIRAGNVNLKEAWCDIRNGEIFVLGMHISPYEKGNVFNKDPLRVRKLLLHKREISKLFGSVKQEGLTLIPLSAYFLRSKVKIELGLCKGKRNYDKRATEKQKDAKREMHRVLKEKNQAG